MNRVANSWWIRCLFAIMAFICMYGISYADEPAYDWDDHNSSLLGWETYYASSRRIDDCFSTGKILWNSSELNQTYMPGTITKDSKPPAAGSQGTAIAMAVANFAGMGLTSLFTGGIGAMFIAGIQLGVMMDACTNTYVVAPHEYFNRNNNKSCSIVGGVAKYKDDDVLTANDVPFFYHCDPKYDPIAKTSLSDTDEKDAKFIGRTYGYMGGASQYCTGRLKDYAKKELVGKIIVESAPWIARIAQWHSCDSTSGRTNREFGPGSTADYVYPLRLVSYYKMFDKSGKIKMCTASIYTMLPLRLACGTIAPPGDENAVDPFLKAYVSDTRCAYLIQPRKDLHALGDMLPQTDQAGKSRKSVKLFLQSDFHFTSTVVGCLKDMILKIFIKVPSGAGVSGEKPFFQKVQERMKQIVMAVLVLYATMVGIKIMTSPEPPKRAEWIMMIVKFALVIYFAIGSGFYEVDKSSGKITGIFPQLIDVTDELANMFLEAQNNNEGLGFCSYAYNGKNLLGENMYKSSAIKTIGQEEGVKLTVWDLVDCKLINYLNLGSCNYTASGLVVAWFVGAAFWVSGYGILLSLCSLVYCFMVLLVIFRFAHIFILALITVTVLIFLAPIFIPFALFEATKGIFNKWMTTIFGYLIYPALLFAFLAIMIATLDAVYYGDFKADSKVGESIDLNAACEGVDSIYCYTMRRLVANSNDACDLSAGSLANNVITSKDVKFMGNKSALKPEFAAGVFPLMLKLMLFAFLFYLFMSSVTSFLSALLSVQDIGGMAKGSINALGALGSMGSAAGSAASGLKNLMSSKKDEK